jgi:uncharacterized membrane protein YkvA (DUF1232 family)
MKKSLSAFLKIFGALMDNEKKWVNQARVANILCIRPSAIVAILLAFFYLCSPVDILPETLLGGVVGVIDDIVVSIAALVFVISELIYCSGVNIISKKLDLPSYDVENEIDKEDDEETQDAESEVGKARIVKHTTKPGKIGQLISKLVNFGSKQSSEEEDGDDYFN